MASETPTLKRPRSPTAADSLHPAKIPRTQTTQLQINYLARQSNDTIPLVTVNEKLPEMLRLIGEYDGVLQRHESMAGNLGAYPLGPILLKRFERLFDGPPRILKSHNKDSNVTWLDVVEFAQNKPEQFNLEKTRNGIRVCQFYTKQCRVEISEEDFVLIASGMPQKLIPPQPILEDEEKELSVMDLLDRNLSQVIQLADQVSGRARQLIHKMKNRRTAILSRREQEPELRRVHNRGDRSPTAPSDVNGLNSRPLQSIEASQSPPLGFTAVNVRPSTTDLEPRAVQNVTDGARVLTEDRFSPSHGGNVTILNGKSIKDASPTLRAQLMKSFMSVGEREHGPGVVDNARRESGTAGRSTTAQASASENKPRSHSNDQSASTAQSKQPSATVAIPGTPASLLPHAKPMSSDRDDGGPFKQEMVGRMELMHRGERVMPPCDRCRRLHMDCLKNLTACMGCTKKHAKCSWKDVRMEELHDGNEPMDREGLPEVGAYIDEPRPMSAGSTIELQRIAREDGAALGTGGLTTGPKTPTSAPAIDGMVSTSTAARGRASEPIPGSVSSTVAGGIAGGGRFDVRPPPLSQQQFREAADMRSPPPTVYAGRVVMEGRKSGIQDSSDEGDRLQALAAQVYRSASQSVRPPED